MKVKQLFSFGIIADVQYADIDDHYNFDKTRIRYYRNAIIHLREAVDKWNESKVDFAIQLGDLIDGFSKKYKKSEKDFENLKNELAKFNSCGLPVSKQGDIYIKKKEDLSEIAPYICHVWGNHDFYNFSREALWKSPLNSFLNPYQLCSNHITTVANYDYYFSFSFKSFRIVVLDTYDISTCGRSPESDEWTKATALLEEHNKNHDKLEPYLNCPQYVAWNGAVSEKQLLWLHDELTAATKFKEKVILLSHIPLHPKASLNNSVCWNCEDILSTINSYTCVVACFAGHFHDGKFFHDKQSNINFITLPGVVERTIDRNAFAVVNVFEDSIEIHGYGGDLDSRTLVFD